MYRFLIDSRLRSLRIRLCYWQSRTQIERSWDCAFGCIYNSQVFVNNLTEATFYPITILVHVSLAPLVLNKYNILLECGEDKTCFIRVPVRLTESIMRQGLHHKYNVSSLSIFGAFSNISNWEARFFIASTFGTHTRCRSYFLKFV